LATAIGNQSSAEAAGGSFDSVNLLGSNSTANAENGFGDQAFIIDFAGRGSLGSDAFAGGAETPGNFDLARIFGDRLIAHSIGDYIAHIAPYF
jgi:hypothetical protein